MDIADASDPRTGRLMQIGEVAERVQLSHRTVRHYDDEGLLTPTRSAGNFRLYTEADVQRLLLIRQMKPLGFSLDDMRHLIAVLDQLATAPGDEQRTQELRTFIATAQERRDKLAQQVRTADAWLEDLRSQL
ncbi:DNA-binding transcriptional MerR regulator [Kineococcus aurantiacus]|uniref:DNA-binding transcriptional MerR regulator n=2 Tax=Kineococcus aurantiacus TaxID=37633 RepID=A0A7Y9DL78_9ACTN|nr:DNA-binding transcriptional MerR regulator [Kineococcus aurantiacus]